jgi:hypothetical protein
MADPKWERSITAPDEKEQKKLLADFVKDQLRRATESKGKAARTAAVRVLAAITLAAEFASVPHRRDVRRLIAMMAADVS